MDPDKKPAVHTTPLEPRRPVDRRPAGGRWSGSPRQGVRFAPGGIRKGAAGYDICLLAPQEQ